MNLGITFCGLIVYVAYPYRVIAVVFQKRIVVLDAGSFENKFVIRSKLVHYNVAV